MKTTDWIMSLIALSIALLGVLKAWSEHLKNQRTEKKDALDAQVEIERNKALGIAANTELSRQINQLVSQNVQLMEFKTVMTIAVEDIKKEYLGTLKKIVDRSPYVSSRRTRGTQRYEEAEDFNDEERG